MSGLHRQPLCIASALLVPFLTLVTPSWLSLSGVGPSWAVIWLLPWSLVDGPISGIVAGLCLGLLLDGLSFSGASQVPALIGLGWWWGRLGRQAPPIQQSLNLGLLSWFGSVLLSLSLWGQSFLAGTGGSITLVIPWGRHCLLSQALVTGLLTPIVGSWLLLLWRQLFQSRL